MYSTLKHNCRYSMLYFVLVIKFIIYTLMQYDLVILSCKTYIYKNKKLIYIYYMTHDNLLCKTIDLKMDID